jgi:hypothetical protein
MPDQRIPAFPASDDLYNIEPEVDRLAQTVQIPHRRTGHHVALLAVNGTERTTV